MTDIMAFKRKGFVQKETSVLPGYMDMADVVMHFSTEMWLHFRNVATNMSYTASRHNLAADISWQPSSYFEISINLKTCIILEWSIIIRCMISTTFKPCETIHLSVWHIQMCGGQLMSSAKLCLEAVRFIANFLHFS